MKIKDIEARISGLSGAEFQNLCDQFLMRKEKGKFCRLGMEPGTDKTAKGTPDTYIKTEEGKYIFIEYTTQKNNLLKKIREDIEKCLSEENTKVPVVYISKIIYICASARLEPCDDKELHDLCNANNVKFEFYSINELARELNENYQDLIRDYLNIQPDTGCVLSLEEFIKEYDSYPMSANLNTAYIDKNDVVEKITKSLADNKIVVMTGVPGIGKTRIALEILRNYGKQNYSPICIKGSFAKIIDEIVYKIKGPGNYILMLDDANDIFSFEQLIDFLYHYSKKSGYKIDILVTVRNYAKGYIINRLAEKYRYDEVVLSAWSESEINLLLDNCFNIKNEKYLEQINEISQGNPRMAFIAGRYAVEKNNLLAIKDASDLLNEYYGTYIEKTNLNSNVKLLITAWVIAFMKCVNKDDLKSLRSIFVSFNITDQEFNDCARILYEKEFINIKVGKVYIAGDQCFANYILYYAVFKKNIISLEDILDEYSLSNTHAIKSLISLYLEVFVNEFVTERLKNAVDEVYLRCVNRNNEVNTKKFLVMFHLYKPFESVHLLKMGLTHFQKYNLTSEDVVELFSGYRNSELLPVFINLMVDYASLDETYYKKIIKLIDAEYSPTYDSNYNDYRTENIVVETLLKNKSETAKSILLDIAAKFLDVYGENCVFRKNKTFVISNFELCLNKGARNYRKLLWEHLEDSIYNHKEQVIEVLEQYVNVDHRCTEKSVIEFDLQFVCKFYEYDLIVSDYRMLFCLSNLCNVCKRLKISAVDLLDKVRYSIKWKYLTLFAEFNTDGTMKLRKKERNEIVVEFANKIRKSDFFPLMLELEEMASTCGQRSYEINNNINLLIAEFCNNKDNANFFVDNFNRNLNIEIRVSDVIRILTSFLGEEKVFIFIQDVSYNANNWEYALFELLPDHKVNTIWEKRFAAFIDKTNDRALKCSSCRSIKTLEKYTLNNKENFFILVKTVFEKRHYSSFIVNLYFESMFFESFFTPYELLEKFSDNIDLLKEIYFYMLDNGSHCDYSGKYLEVFLENDNSWLKYLGFFFKEHIESGLKCYHIFYTLWKNSEYLTVFDYLFEIYCEHSSVMEYYYNDIFLKIITGDQYKKIMTDKQLEWFKHQIDNNIADIERIKMLFHMIAQFDESKRLSLILFFLEKNLDINDFKQITLEPNCMCWSGSQIPVEKQRIAFIRSIRDSLKQHDILTYIEHIAYLESIISSMDSYRKTIEIHEAMEVNV